MCCGSRRSAWRAATAAPAATSTRSPVRQDSPGTAPAAPASAAPGMQGSFPTVTLRYTEASAIRVRGPVTARLYEFSESQPDQAVDIRDAAVLHGNHAFQRGQDAGQPGAD